MNINKVLLQHANQIFFAAALLAGMASLYHLYYAFTTAGNIMTRHIVFIFINVLLVFLLLKRPGYFVFLFAILCVQQLYDHGTRFVRLLSENKFDWISAGIIIIIPFILYLLILENSTSK